MSRSPDPALRAAWQRRLQALEAYPGTVRQFCDEQGVSVSAVYQWRGKLAEHRPADKRSAKIAAHDPPPRFVPLTLVSDQQADARRPLISIQLAGGAHVEIDAEDLQLVQAVLESVLKHDASLIDRRAAQPGGAE